MVLIDEDVLAEKRAAILALSLENAHEPKFGYFGFTGPLAIGDSSLAPQAKRKVVKDDDSGEPIRNVICNPPKKGAGVDAYFSFAPPLSNGQDYIDPYIDPLLRTKKPKLVPIDPEKMFMPAGKVVTKIREGEGRVPELKKDYKHIASYVNLPEMVGFRDPLAMHAKYKDVTGPRNFYTRPLKKGGGGIYTPGVLFGDPKRGEENEAEQNFFWLHVPDEYDYWKKLKKAELEWHQSKLQEQNFSSMSYGNKCFFSDRETFFTELSRGIPREEKSNNYKPYPHEAPFFPSRPPRKGYNACLGEFPKHMPDPVPEAKFQKGSAEEGPPPWNPATKKVVGKPDPSVQTNMRNLRRENPRSFVRPVL